MSTGAVVSKRETGVVRLNTVTRVTSHLVVVQRGDGDFLEQSHSCFAEIEYVQNYLVEIHQLTRDEVAILAQCLVTHNLQWQK